MTLRDEEENQGEIWVIRFDEASASSFRRQVLAVSAVDSNAVIPIYIDSYGGNVDSLAKMLETMDEVPNRFVTICMGKAISCGAVLLSHGDLRFCGRLSRVMVHNISAQSWGDTYSLKADSDETHRMNIQFMGLLAKNCNLTYSALQEMIKNAIGSKEIWMNAEAAKKFNIVDEIGIPKATCRTEWAFEIPPIKPRFNRDKGTKKKAVKKSK